MSPQLRKNDWAYCSAKVAAASGQAAFTYEWDNDVSLFLRHLGGHGQEHQHVVALGHAHGVQVAQHVRARDLAWK